MREEVVKGVLSINKAALNAFNVGLAEEPS